jgi:hypothetical protein
VIYHISLIQTRRLRSDLEDDISTIITARKKQSGIICPKTPYFFPLLVLRLPALRILWLLLSTVRPALRRPSLHWNLLPSCSASRLHHVLHVRPVLEVLVEFADVAADVLVGLETEGYDGDEAEAICRVLASRIRVWRRVLGTLT